MNIYIEYEECKKKYNEIKKIYESAIAEKEQAFMKTQPKGLKYDKVSVEGGNKSNLFDNYLIEVEKKQLDFYIEEAKELLETRRELLKNKELELRNSKDWKDKIYSYKYLDKLPVKAMIHLIPYEEAQMYRILQEIKKNIEGIEDEQF